MIIVGCAVSYSPVYSLVAGSSASYSSSLSQNCSEAAEAPPHRYSWAHIARKQVLARESQGAFFLYGRVNGLNSHGSSFLKNSIGQRNKKLTSRR